MYGKASLFRVRVNLGGYDDNGSYWGVGAPLYCCVFLQNNLEATHHYRAVDREHAKELVLRDHPTLRFHR